MNWNAGKHGLCALKTTPDFVVELNIEIILKKKSDTLPSVQMSHGVPQGHEISLSESNLVENSLMGLAFPTFIKPGFDFNHV